jgi:hypothetical protein
MVDVQRTRAGAAPTLPVKADVAVLASL